MLGFRTLARPARDRAHGPTRGMQRQEHLASCVRPTHTAAATRRGHRRAPDRHRAVRGRVRRDRRPITSPTPPPTVAVPPPRRPRASAPFRAEAYPAAGDAPCGQAEPPDAGHAAYTGELKRIRRPTPTTVVFELCAPDVAFLSKIAAPAFAINDTGWLASHIDPAATRPQADRHRGQRHGPVPARALGSWLGGQPRPERRLLGRHGQERAGDRPLGRRSGASASRAPGRDRRRHRRHRRRRTSRRSSTMSACSSRPGPGSRRLLPRLHRHLRTVRQRARPAGARDGHRPRAASSTPFFPPGSSVATPLHAVRHPARLRRRPVVRVRPAPAKELLAAAGFPDGFDTTIQYSDAPTAVPARPDRHRRPSSRPSCSPTSGSGRARGRAGRHLSSPTSTRASSTGSTCSARA